VLGFVHRHFTGLAAGLPATVFLLDCVLFLCGTFGFVMAANTVLQWVVGPPVGRLRCAGRTAVTTGALTVPVALGLRDAIWSTCGFGAHVTTPGQLATLTLAGGLLTGTIAFAIALNNRMSQL